MLFAASNLIDMKNLSLILNMVLLILVAFLYYKIYNNPAKPDAPKSLPPPKAGTVVFLNADTLFEHYNLFKELTDRFDKKRDSIDNLLRSKDAALKQDAANYQQRAETMSVTDRQRTEEALMARNSDLLQLKDNLYDELSRSQDFMQDTIHKNITAFLKEFNKDKNYAFILSYQKGSGVLLANDSLDITSLVLDGLNKQK